MIKLWQQLMFSVLTLWCFGESRHQNFSNDTNNTKACECVSFVLCENESQIIDGAGLIDMRTVKKRRSTFECENILEVCCEPPNIRRDLPNKDLNKTTLQHPSDRRTCGVRNADGVGPRIMSQSDSQAKFGEFPWMIAVLRNTAQILDLYQCGGSLIHRKVVLTAAHCVHGKNTSEFKIRAGEWDTQSTNEILPHQDRSVEAIVIHENYDPITLRNDFAILILSSSVNLAENVNIACLPDSIYEFDSSRCIVSGWGKNEFGKKGQYGAILKNVHLSMTPRVSCQNSLRKTRLGTKFELDKSFVCAGGFEGHDSCKGDGGSPLICPLKSNYQRFVQVGIVSWGIGCGSNLPGVYASVRYARNWIDNQLKVNNLDNNSYEHEINIGDINAIMVTTLIFILCIIFTLSVREVFLKANDLSSNYSTKNNFNNKHNFFFDIEEDTFYPNETSEKEEVKEESGVHKARISELKCIEYSKNSSESFWILKQSPIEVRRECPRVANRLIAGGKATEPREFPHMAAFGKRLNEYTTEYFCAGSIISENWILTAAHCADSVIDFPTVVLLGSNVINSNNSELKGGKLIPTKRIILHPKYHSPHLYADIALIELSEPVSFNSALKPACLYSLPIPAPKRLWVSGWGASGLYKPAMKVRLAKTGLRVLNSDRCTQVRWDRVTLPRGFDGATQMCAGDPQSGRRSDTCAGDSGAPLQARHPLGCLAELFAVTSFGAPCGSPGVPGVYTRISPYVAWIESIVWPKSKAN